MRPYYLKKPPQSTAYSTKYGAMIHGLAEEVLGRHEFMALNGKVQLIFTSPPFPLRTKKRYGNLQGEDYLEWLAAFGPRFKALLKDNGSIVIELGNSWEPGVPAMSTLALKALLRFQEDNGFFLCQEFICHNPARLPGPAQWVTIERIRLKDSYTRLWWLATTARPDADNRRVLREYSESMKRLLRRGSYNSGRRPSEHYISENAFAKDQGGSIPASMLSIANTGSNDAYQQFCRKTGIGFHPARMPAALPEFFIRYLTSPGDIVVDPFGGSNTTGAAAEVLRRHWISIEPRTEYIAGSVGRFDAGAVRMRELPGGGRKGTR